ncbi:MAG TPA: GNAT family N-acetyltransferase, partial [Nitrospirales bacterium]|nr:GNAT family N-acetyltransferase [Nitrospirales bacterium]
PGLIALLDGSEPWRTLGYTRRDWEAFFDTLERGPGRDAYVVERESEVVGIAVLRRRFLVGDYLELLAVAPAVRRGGIGAALLAHVEHLVFPQSRNLFVCVSDFNTEARRFYERHGYREVGPLAELLVAGHAELLLRKTIGPARESRS